MSCLICSSNKGGQELYYLKYANVLVSPGGVRRIRSKEELWQVMQANIDLLGTSEDEFWKEYLLSMNSGSESGKRDERCGEWRGFLRTTFGIND